MTPSSYLSLEVRRNGEAAVVSARGDIDLSTLAKATVALGYRFAVLRGRG